MVNLTVAPLKIVLFMETMVIHNGWIISVQENLLQSVKRLANSMNFSLITLLSSTVLIFMLTHFLEECFRYYGQNHYNLNFSAKPIDKKFKLIALKNAIT